MGPTSFWGFFCPNLPRVFLNLLFVGTCYIFFRSVGILSTEIRFFASKSKKEKVRSWIELRTVFNVKTTILRRSRRVLIFLYDL